MRNVVLRGLAGLLYPLVVSGGIWLGGWACWGSILLGGTVYPLIDTIKAKRESVVGAAKRTELIDRSEQIVLVCVALIEVAVLAWALTAVSTKAYSSFELIGIALSLGTLTGGIGLPAAHELIHRSNAALRSLGSVLLGCVLYTHFRIEHIYGHHLHAATLDDPATARRGEGLWTFILRSVAGQLISAYNIAENQRRLKRRRLNVVVNGWLAQALLLIAIAGVFGLTGLTVFVGQAFVAVIFLEATNYVEHYGLTRGKRADGRYEAISERHAWNTSSRLTNLLTFNLGFHAHHHIAATVPYGALRNLAGGPQLPAGYLAMIVLAAVPPLWRRVIEPHLPPLAPAVAPPPAMMTLHLDDEIEHRDAKRKSP